MGGLVAVRIDPAKNTAKARPNMAEAHSRTIRRFLLVPELRSMPLKEVIFFTENSPGLPVRIFSRVL